MMPKSKAVAAACKSQDNESEVPTMLFYDPRPDINELKVSLPSIPSALNGNATVWAFHLYLGAFRHDFRADDAVFSAQWWRRDNVLLSKDHQNCEESSAPLQRNGQQTENVGDDR